MSPSPGLKDVCEYCGGGQASKAAVALLLDEAWCSMTPLACPHQRQNLLPAVWTYRLPFYFALGTSSLAVLLDHSCPAMHPTQTLKSVWPKLHQGKVEIGK